MEFTDLHVFFLVDQFNTAKAGEVKVNSPSPQLTFAETVWSGFIREGRFRITSGKAATLPDPRQTTGGGISDLTRRAIDRRIKAVFFCQDDHRQFLDERGLALPRLWVASRHAWTLPFSFPSPEGRAQCQLNLNQAGSTTYSLWLETKRSQVFKVKFGFVNGQVFE